jgi:hypothetical protein
MSYRKKDREKRSRRRRKKKEMAKLIEKSGEREREIDTSLSTVSRTYRKENMIRYQLSLMIEIYFFQINILSCY